MSAYARRVEDRRHLVPFARFRRALVLIVVTAAPSAGAVESLEGAIAAITGDDWRVTGLSFSIRLQPSLRGTVRIDSLELPSADLAFSGVLADCGRMELSAAEFGCLDAQFTIDPVGTGPVTFPGEAVYERKSGSTRFALRDIPLAQGKIAVRGTAAEDAVEIEYAGDELQLPELAEIAARFAPAAAALTAAGSSNLSGAVRIRSGEVASASMTAELSDTSVSNDAGTVVAEGLHALLDLTVHQGNGRWHFDIDLSSDGGEAYVEPVYANFSESRLAFAAEGSVDEEFSDVELTTFAMTQGSAIDASGTLHARMAAAGTGTAVSGSIELRDSSVEAIYSGLLQVFLAGTAAGDLVMEGTVAGAVAFHDNELSAFDLTLERLGIDDKHGRFAVHGLHGTIRWPGPGAAAADAETSRLVWESASAWNVPLGGAAIEAKLGGDDFHLSAPLRIPTMGGALLVNHLVLNNFGKEDASGLLDAELAPIELGQLTGAFGWPAFSGSLAGQLPFLQYDGGVVTVGGTLSARAFDGDIELANLRLEEPFSLVPRLYGDLRMRKLDLEQLTDTFSFGLIQGRLSGDVTGLEMIAWKPVAMDLHLYTPPRDSSRRRISQRAVENLANVGGGGAAAALSSGFMKFFEEFSYDSIGIRCVLRDGTCGMSGTGPAGESQFGQGYYIVKGSGLPRIDVVGYRHQVSFNALVRQLEAITEGGAPVVR